MKLFESRIAASADERIRILAANPVRIEGVSLDLLGIATLVLATTPILFYSAIVHVMPMGYAGLYSLMAEAVAAQGYAPPSQIPFYGPGGMPFAYPPLAIYVMAVVTKTLGVPIFDYLRFVPPLLTTSCLLPMYLLSRKITSSRAKAFVAAFLMATSTLVLDPHLYAAGAVRALAFLIMLFGLLVSLEAMESGRRSTIALAACLFGLTAVTHLSYAMFFAASLAVFTLGGTNFRKRVNRMVVIAVGGVVLATPWWLTVLVQHGYETFVIMARTHGGATGSIPALRQPLSFIKLLLVQTIPVDSPALTFGHVLSLLGLIYCISTRRWLLPLWFFAALVLVPEGHRYWEMIGAISAAIVIVELSALIPANVTVPGRQGWNVSKVLFIVLLLSLPYYSLWTTKGSFSPVLSSRYLDVATWVQEQTPANAKYLLVTASEAEAEWAPYLFRRVPVIAPWGAEWTGQYVRQSQLYDVQAECARTQSMDCLDGVFQRLGERPDYLIVASPARLSMQLRGSSTWTLKFENPGYAVYRSGTQANPQT